MMELKIFLFHHFVYVAAMASLCFFVYYCYIIIEFMTYYQYSMNLATKKVVNAKNLSTNNGNQRYDCGVILHAHINKCAGGTVRKWFSNHAPICNIESNEGLYDKNVVQYEPVWRKMIPQVDRFLANVSPKTGWRVLHVHHKSPGLMLIENYIKKWEKSVEAKGCIFYKTTVLRDPLDRFISNVNFNNVSLNIINSFMESRRNWLIRYLLFGLCGYEGKHLKCGYERHGIHTHTSNLTKNHMKEIYKIANGFDLIGFKDDLDGYFDKIRQITGWRNEVNQVNRIHRHKSSDTFNLTRSLISKFIYLNENDYMFYYAMRNKSRQNF